MYVVQTLAGFLRKKFPLSPCIRFRSINSTGIDILVPDECLQLVHSGDSCRFSQFLFTTLLQELEIWNVGNGFIVMLDNEISTFAIHATSNTNPNLAVLSSNNPETFLNTVDRLVRCEKPIFAIVLDSLSSFNYHPNLASYLQALKLLNEYVRENNVLLVFGVCDFFTNQIDEAISILCRNLQPKVAKYKKNCNIPQNFR